jgi:hypothetical protein
MESLDGVSDVENRLIIIVKVLESLFAHLNVKLSIHNNNVNV